MRRKFTCYRCGKYVEAEMDTDGDATCPACENVIGLEPERKLQNRIASLEAEVEALKAERRWIPVSEPPKIDGRYLLRNIYGDVYSSKYVVKTETWVVHDFAMFTHWMPLPLPPEGRER